MNKLILNDISYIIKIANNSDEACANCALHGLNGGCCTPCEVFDFHMKKTIKGSCYFMKENEKIEETKEAITNKKIEVAKKLYDVLGSLECDDDCPLIEICESPNTICNELKDVIND